MIQVAISGLAAGASAAPADDPVSLLAAAVCASAAGADTRATLPGHATDRRGLCLASCLGALAAGRIATPPRLDTPIDLALADVEIARAAAIVPTASIDGHGARAPPSQPA